MWVANGSGRMRQVNVNSRCVNRGEGMSQERKRKQPCGAKCGVVWEQGGSGRQTTVVTVNQLNVRKWNGKVV